MSEIINNAVISIALGIEDYKSNDPRRPISAIRNFYAGVLLLGKECLLQAAPDAAPMGVLASQFVPVSDGDGGVKYEARGHKTIDLSELRARFKAFELEWPDGDIGSLQRLRNQFEHYHSPAPHESIRAAIANCFPLVAGFFELLALDPSESLGEAWSIMVQEEAFYAKQKSECNQTLKELPWFDELGDCSDVRCPTCESSLLGQRNPENKEPTEIAGKCRACGTEIDALEFVTAVVDGLYGADAFLSAKDGEFGVIYDCIECGNATYVESDDTVMCFFCGDTISGECARCGTPLGISNQSVDTSNLCDYCGYISTKDD